MTSPAEPLDQRGSPEASDRSMQGAVVGGLPLETAARRLSIPDIDVWVWALVAGLLLLVRISPGMAPDLYNDSFQYFSVAENTLNGHFGYTSLVHFDAERSFGVIPAPQVTTALGYPMAIALLNLTGLSIQGAALLVSGASTIACVFLLAWIGGRLNLSRPTRNVVLACYVLNAAAIQFGTSALSDALFTFFVLLGLALLLAAQLRADSTTWWPWIAAGLAFGGAYLVRYAGLFFVIGLALLILRHLLVSNRLLARGHAIALASASLAVAAGMARNIALVGDWRGGNEKLTNNPLASVLLDVLRGASGAVLGIGIGPGQVIPRALLIVTFLLAMSWLFVERARGPGLDPQADGRPLNTGVLIDYVLLAAVYVAGLVYAGLFSVIPPNPRYFVPLIPIFLLVLGAGLQLLFAPTGPDSRRSRRLPALILGASFCLYAYLNFTALRLPRVDEASLVASQMDVISSSGTSAREAIRDHVGASKVIVANNGQAVGFVVDLPTVSLVAPLFSSVTWDENTVHETMRRFDASVLVISVPPPGTGDDDGYVPSPFVRLLTTGEAPGWLRLIHQTDDLFVYVTDATTS